MFIAHYSSLLEFTPKQYKINEEPSYNNKLKLAFIEANQVAMEAPTSANPQRWWPTNNTEMTWKQYGKIYQ